jgi:DNA-binding NarL/FixJ family response regulator
MHDLAWAIREAFAGKCVYMSEGKPITVDASCVRPAGGITDRESQVLELITMGLANKQIAAKLGISIKTVEKHRHRVMCKLQAHETAGLTWRAICMGVARSSPSLAMLSV